LKDPKTGPVDGTLSDYPISVHRWPLAGGLVVRGAGYHRAPNTLEPLQA